MSEENLKTQAKKAVYWSTFANVSNQCMAFAIGIILARLLSPEDFGVIALPTIFLAVAQCFIDSGFGSALVRKPELKEEDLSTAFYFNVIVGVFFYTLLFFCSPLIAVFYDTPILTDVLRVTALSTLFGPLQAVHFALLSRNMDFKTQAKISVSCQITTGIVGVALAYLGWGIWALVFQGVASQLMRLAMVWIMSPWRPKTGWSNESFSYLFGFGSKLLCTSITDIIYNNINAIVIGKFYTKADLGVYNRGYGYAQLPYNQINGIITGVSFPLLSKLQNDSEKLNDYLKKMMGIVMYTLTPILLLLAALARPLILFMLTDKWESCIIILQIMCFAIFLWPIQSLNFTLFTVKGQTDTLFKTNIVLKVIGLIIKAITLPLGIIAICFGNLVHAIIATSYTAFFAGRYTDLGIKKQYKLLTPIFLLSLTMFFVVLFVNTLITSYILQIIIGGTVGISVYLLGSLLFRMQELQDLISFIKSKKHS